MVKKNTIVIIAIVILFCASLVSCNQNGVSSELPEEDGAEEITISLCQYEPDNIKTAAKRFELETGVKVNIQNSFDLSDGNDLGRTKYGETALIELMSGTGADIYDVAGLDFQNLGTRKMLCNMKNWVEQTPELSDEKLFSNIFHLTEKDDALYAIPTGFYVYVLGASADAPDLGEQPITWEQFFERTKDTPRNGSVFSNTDTYIFTSRFAVRESTFIDEKNKTQSLNSPEMVSLLKQCKQWSEEGLCSTSMDAGEGVTPTPLFTDIMLRHFACVLLRDLPYNYPESINSIKKIYPLPSDSEAGNEANISTLFAINAASKKQRTAWEFLKFLYSEDVQKYFVVEFPVNRNAFNYFIEHGVRGLNVEMKDKDVEQVKADATKLVENIDSATYQTPIHTIIREIADDYFYNKISAEEAAKKMADKVGLYLKELS